MNEFTTYIKAVGTGPKGNRDLSESEMYRVMQMILSGEATTSQIAAFLIGWRLKPETVEEYRGALSALKEKSKTIVIENSFELGFPYDGKNHSPYLFPLVAGFMKKYGISLVVVGDEKIPSKEGMTTKEFAAQFSQMENVHYIDRRDRLPALSQLSGLRNELGLRTAFNTLEKFSGMASSEYGASGVFHKPYVEKYKEIFKDKLKGFVLVAGNEGSPELFKKSRCWFVKKGEMEEMLIDPLDYDIHWEAVDAEISMDDCLSMVKKPPADLRKLAALNAAIYLYSMDKGNQVRDIYNELIGL